MNMLINALKDRQFWSDVGSNARDVAQGASNAAASTITGPIDAMAWALRKANVPVPEDSIGSTIWAAQKGLTAEPKNRNLGLLGEGLGMSTPIAASAGAARLAQGLLAVERNLATPQTMSSQAGMMRIPGRGQIPETASDVNKLATRFAGLLDDAKVNYTADKSGISPARYFSFDKPANATHTAEDIAQYGAEPFKVRISDHRNVHGADYSVDPHTGQTFEEMVKHVQNMGVPIANKVKPVSKAVIPDDVLEKIWGIPIDRLKQSGMLDRERGAYKLSPQGYWVKK